MKKKLLTVFMIVCLLLSTCNVKRVFAVEDANKKCNDYTVKEYKESTSENGSTLYEALRVGFGGANSSEDIRKWLSRAKAFSGLNDKGEKESNGSEGYINVCSIVNGVPDNMKNWIIQANAKLNGQTINGFDWVNWAAVPIENLENCTDENEAKNYSELFCNVEINMGEINGKNYILKINALLNSSGYLAWERDSDTNYDRRKQLVAKIQETVNKYPSLRTDSNISGIIGDTGSDTIGANTSPNDTSTEEVREHAEALSGGKLLTPIFDLLVTIGDGFVWLVQKAVMGTDSSISLNFALKLITVIIGIIAAIAAVVVIAVVTAGVGAIVAGIGGAIGSALTAIGSTGIVSTIITVAAVGAGLASYHFATTAFSAKFLPDITVFPTYSISPEEIFEGRILLFDINFFSPKQLKVHLKSGVEKNEEDYKEEVDGEAEYYFYEDGKEQIITSKQNIATALSKTISKWYYTIRNLAIVIMLLILIYIGIRMILCSIASEKSKYKKMLADWVISMCLVFVLHYIMVFTVSVNEDIVKLISKSVDKNTYAIALANVNEKDKFVDVVEKNQELRSGLANSAGQNLYNEDGSEATTDSSGKAITDRTATMFIWPTNLMGQMRMMTQMQDGTVAYLGYTVAFIVLVFYTVFFAATYLKRVIYMAFLTIIAPLVAMTYSIDKINDGKAQAFNMWLKEYIFNLLIQPVHLLLYLVLISTSFDLAGENIVYTLVAIGFMMPAEKLIRQMFGFEKAKTPGFLGGPAGAALTMSAMQSLGKIAGRGGKDSKQEKPPKMSDKAADTSDERSADSGWAELFSGEGANPPPTTTQGSEGSTGPSAADANINPNGNGNGNAEDPVARAERESLEERLADGQITEAELTPEQRALLGMDVNNNQNPNGDEMVKLVEDKIAKKMMVKKGNNKHHQIEC